MRAVNARARERCAGLGSDHARAAQTGRHHMADVKCSRLQDVAPQDCKNGAVTRTLGGGLWRAHLNDRGHHDARARASNGAPQDNPADAKKARAFLPRRRECFVLVTCPCDLSLNCPFTGFV